MILPAGYDNSKRHKELNSLPKIIKYENNELRDMNNKQQNNINKQTTFGSMFSSFSNVNKVSPAAFTTYEE